MENQGKGRNMLLPMLALLKKNIVSAFSEIGKATIFKARLENDKVFYSYMAQLGQKLDVLIEKIADLPKIEMKDSPASIQIQTMGKETIGKIIEELVSLRDTVKQNKIFLPRVQEVRGKVEVTGQQYIPYDRMLGVLKSIEEKIGSIRIEFPPQKGEIKFPEFPKSIQVAEIARVIDAIAELRDEIRLLPKKIPKADMPEAMRVHVDNFPPQKYPLPVTNININPLRGYAKSRNITVGTTATPLPDEVLAYRRSVVCYNASTTTTLYIGGSDVTSTNGMPVPPASYSPAIDAGPKLIIYGIVASGSADVRVLEMSNENIGA